MSVVIKPKLVVPKEKFVPEWKRQYRWIEDNGGYIVFFEGNDFMSLRPVDNKWEFKLKYGFFELLGTRDDLESAYRVVDDELYRQDRQKWVRTISTVVIQKFSIGALDRMIEEADAEIQRTKENRKVSSLS